MTSSTDKPTPDDIDIAIQEARRCFATNPHRFCFCKTVVALADEVAGLQAELDWLREGPKSS